MDRDGTGRRLVLLRHAKSDWPQGVRDLDRPLAERGIADAAAAGGVLAELGPPDLVLCSPANRTRQTWALVAAVLDPEPVVRVEPLIYGAEVGEILQLLGTIMDGALAVVVVGHEPTMSQVAATLAGPGSDPAGLERLRQKYPTCGMAVFDLPPGSAWSDLGPGTARLDRFLVPRG